MIIKSGGLWNYYRNKVNDAANKNNDGDYSVNNEKTRTRKSFEYKTKKQGAPQIIVVD